MATVADVARAMEGLFPTVLAEDWDRVGLAVGNERAEVRRVLFAVDPAPAIVDEAIAWGAQMIVTHHPLLLRGITSVSSATAKGSQVMRLVTAGIAQYAAHTNADRAAGGTNDALATAFGMTDVRPLVPGDGDDAHVGLGRIGRVEPTTLGRFAQAVADALPTTAAGVTAAGDLDGEVRTVAVVGGSGAEFVADAARAGADVFVTADIKHHPATDAREEAERGDGRPFLVHVSHAASESLWLAAAARHVAEQCGVECRVSETTTDPWTGHFQRRDN